MPTTPSRFSLSINELEREVRVPRDQQIEGHQADPPRTYVEPADLDRAQTLVAPTQGWTLDLRR